MSVSDPKVFLVGAGPGNPGLLTLRAAEVLAQADLVLHDQLVPRRLLDLARPGAETMCVRELPGNHPDKYPHIHNLLIERARAGQTVVRLKGGDPLIFGRGGEEAESLRQAGIDYEIVPGITAALAAGAFLDIPLTHRSFASAVALVTGHELPHKPGNPLDWKALAAFPGTLCIYMGVARLPVIVAELLKHGKDPATPACIVERASTGDQRTVYSRLDVLEEARRNAGLEAPGLIVVGEAVSRRPERSWWESRPLFGRRVLVTRPAHQAGEMVRKLERLGAVVYRLPAVEIRPPADWTPVDRVIHELSGAGLVLGGTGVLAGAASPESHSSPGGAGLVLGATQKTQDTGEDTGATQNAAWNWIVFTSANGVHAFLNRIETLGLDLRILGGVKLAAIGPKTAVAMREYHLNADIVPDTFNSEGLVAALRTAASRQRVLLARANRGRELLRDELAKVADVRQIVVYDQVDSVEPDADVLDHLRRGEVHYVTLSSSKIAENLLRSFDETMRGRVERGEIELVAISPETGKAIRALGFRVAAEAERFTADGLIDAVVRLAERTPA